MVNNEGAGYERSSANSRISGTTSVVAGLSSAALINPNPEALRPRCSASLNHLVVAADGVLDCMLGLADEVIAFK